jgi:hypothetical protein
MKPAKIASNSKLHQSKTITNVDGKAYKKYSPIPLNVSFVGKKKLDLRSLE